MPRCTAVLFPILGLLLLGGCERVGEATEPAPTPAAQTAAAPSAKARLPYARIQAIALGAAQGEIIEVELDAPDPDKDDAAGSAIYEITVLTPSGRVLELEIDAVTGLILKQEAE
jgi:uncharacterized membrane protein YkoI